MVYGIALRLFARSQLGTGFLIVCDGFSLFEGFEKGSLQVPWAHLNRPKTKTVTALLSWVPWAGSVIVRSLRNDNQISR